MTIHPTHMLTGEMTPLVNTTFSLSNQRYVVNCAACDGMVQFTGEGGYVLPEDAQTAAQEHRIRHLNALKAELLMADPHVDLS